MIVIECFFSPNLVSYLVQILSLVCAWTKVLPVSPVRIFRCWELVIISRRQTETHITTVTGVECPQVPALLPSQTRYSLLVRSNFTSYTRCNLQYLYVSEILKLGDFKSKHLQWIKSVIYFAKLSCQCLLPAELSILLMSFHFLGISSPKLNVLFFLGPGAMLQAPSKVPKLLVY